MTLSCLVAANPQIASLDSSVFQVAAIKPDGNAVGTGFLVDKAGHVVTNHHVVADASSVAVRLGGSHSPREATIVASSKALDLAVISVGPTQRLPLPLAGNLPAKGATVYAMGFPGDADIPSLGGSAADATVTSGVLSRIFAGAWVARELTILQHDADINPGSSGGPLLDECGRVIGVNTAGTVTTVTSSDGRPQVVPAASGLYWASSVSELAHELDQLAISYRLDQAPCAPSTQVLAPTFGQLPPVPEAANRSLGSLYAAALSAIAATLAFLLIRAGRNTRKLSEILERVDLTALTSAAPSRRRGSLALRHAQLVLSPVGSDSLEGSLVVEDADAMQDGLVLGRHPMLVDRVVDRPGVSRRHLRISFSLGRFRVEDLNSTNGSSLSRSPLAPYTPAQIRSGDVLRIGNVEFNVDIQRRKHQIE